ncbi:helix-turn-helix domain-containing protein [Mycolicibacterium llatzerense]|uniref:helix-turn-helix domain-containing protein n=1 Tax=Mycolicibacterium llatzerense TaxID=280871 RepID=UPI0021B4F59C|nr:helix-turn-helix domain-containing protein [Mycolicibacterium llatzerense]MCT7373189.1 hypothetical protein [Mycolicibacterium llatzerense]
MKLYPLNEVIASWDLADKMSDPERWLQRQIRSGRVTARKVGRHWFMTQADIDAALERFASKQGPEPVVEVDVPRRVGSAASLKRRIA